MRPIIYAAIIFLAGCGGSVKNTKMHISASKGVFGGSADLDVDSQFNGEIVGLKYNKSLGEFECERVTVVSNVVDANASVVPVIDARARYNQVTYAGLVDVTDAINRSPIIKGLGAAFEQAPSILQGYIAARTQVQLGQSQYRAEIVKAIAQAAASYKAGTTSNPQQMFNLAAPDLVREAVATYPDAFGTPANMPVVVPAKGEN